MRNACFESIQLVSCVFLPANPSTNCSRKNLVGISRQCHNLVVDEERRIWEGLATLVEGLFVDWKALITRSCVWILLILRSHRTEALFWQYTTDNVVSDIVSKSRSSSGSIWYSFLGGMQMMICPHSRLPRPNIKHQNQWSSLKLWVANSRPPYWTINTCATKDASQITQKTWFLKSPFKMFLSPCTWREFSSLKRVIRTNELNTMVKCSLLGPGTADASGTFNSWGPENIKGIRTASWYKPWPMMFLYIKCDISGWLRPYGRRFSNSWVGFSEASARDANVSMIKLIHNIWTARRGLSWMVQAPRNATIIATRFTVNWNWKLILFCKLLSVFPRIKILQ